MVAHSEEMQNHLRAFAHTSGPEEMQAPPQAPGKISGEARVSDAVGLLGAELRRLEQWAQQADRSLIQQTNVPGTVPALNLPEGLGFGSAHADHGGMSGLPRVPMRPPGLDLPGDVSARPAARHIRALPDDLETVRPASPAGTLREGETEMRGSPQPPHRPGSGPRPGEARAGSPPRRPESPPLQPMPANSDPHSKRFRPYAEDSLIRSRVRSRRPR